MTDICFVEQQLRGVYPTCGPLNPVVHNGNDVVRIDSAAAYERSHFCHRSAQLADKKAYFLVNVRISRLRLSYRSMDWTTAEVETTIVNVLFVCLF